MAISSRRSVQIPPDSTGKHIANSFVLHLDYDAKTGTFSPGDIVTGASSGVQGEVLEVIEVSGAPTIGQLVLKMEGDYYDSTFTDDEGLLVNAVQQALANSIGTPIYYNRVVLAGGNNPANLQSIDDEGAQSVRFPEGAPLFDAFGNMAMIQLKSIVDYDHVETPSSMLSDIIVNSASGSYSQNESLYLLTNTAGSNDKITRRSNIWHKYQPGETVRCLMTLICGDTGKSNLIRRWGYFDDDDGLFFELSGSALSVVQRSSVTGTPVETKVAQANWNGDILDGTGGNDNVTKHNLDLTKNNVYFIDFQWLGSGQQRFGIFAEGKRIVSHTFFSESDNSRPWSKRASLPISVEQENIGTTSGTSETRFVCATVQSAEPYSPRYNTYSEDFGPYEVTGSVDPVSGSEGFFPLVSFRPSKLSNAGVDNRHYYIPEKMEIYSNGIDAVFALHKNTILSGSVWTSGSLRSALDIDTASSASQAGERITTAMVPSNGFKEISLHAAFESPPTWMSRHADIDIDPDHYTLMAKAIPNSSNNTGSLFVSIDYHDYE
jgi:hypothetical protein